MTAPLLRHTSALTLTVAAATTAGFLAAPVYAADGAGPLSVTSSTTLTFSMDDPDDVTVTWPETGGTDVQYFVDFARSEEEARGGGGLGVPDDAGAISCSGGSCTWQGQLEDVEPGYWTRVTANSSTGEREGFAALLPDDVTPPEATFTVPETAWLGQDFAITMDSYTDDQTEFADDDGTEHLMSVNGGDQEFFREYFAPSVPGPFNVTVYVSDQSGNKQAYELDPIQIIEDTAPPVMTVTVPPRANRAASWGTLTGTATDNRGVYGAYVGLVQQRGGAWYAYDPGDEAWHRAGATQKSALRSKHYFMAYAEVVDGTWSTAVAEVTKGTLVVRYKARDVTKLWSPVQKLTQKVTRR